MGDSWEAWTVSWELFSSRHLSSLTGRSYKGPLRELVGSRINFKKAICWVLPKAPAQTV